METVIVVVCLMLLAILVGILIGLLITYVHDNGFGEKNRNMTGQGPMNMYGSTTSFGRVWHLELWNASTNQMYSKDFCGQVMLGRGNPSTELFWQMRIGEDPTISREQCVIYDRGGFLLMENVSQVNTTRLNGVPVTTPFMIYQGSQLDMGHSRFYVSNIQRSV